MNSIFLVGLSAMVEIRVPIYLSNFFDSGLWQGLRLAQTYIFTSCKYINVVFVMEIIVFAEIFRLFRQLSTRCSITIRAKHHVGELSNTDQLPQTYSLELFYLVVKLMPRCLWNQEQSFAFEIRPNLIINVTRSLITIAGLSVTTYICIAFHWHACLLLISCDF